ncbi:hypothetical protein [Desulfopila aestuarii]|uniref:Uncharacterized protein n=1 Tax=Desulfopila aestuarii DSM 18488 TaxID=1121416 RepID=A0A1M7XXI9_9BACT|nr:hypothetical protein [Desulfopila aestuarii]SHO43659.1 hypothetical protein SAMN02745220_00458 [Desulfopila aestuarii DSM 18488]
MHANRKNKALWSWLVIFQIALFTMYPFVGQAELVLNLQAEIATDAELDVMRGGFTSGDGLEISFGIEQAVLIDGILKVATSINTSSIAGMLARQTGTSSSLPISAEKIQSQLTTVIQNSLDQRIIDKITVINASVNSLSLTRQLNTINAIQQLNMAARR